MKAFSSSDNSQFHFNLIQIAFLGKYFASFSWLPLKFSVHFYRFYVSCIFARIFCCTSCIYFFYEPQAVSSSARDIVVAWLHATYFHGSAATSIQRDASGGEGGWRAGHGNGGANMDWGGAGCDFLKPCLSGSAAMLIAKAFVMPSRTNTHPTRVLPL